MTDRVTLVTGASGFLGRLVLRRLSADGHRVVGLDPRPATGTAPHVIDDLSDREKLRSLLSREKVTHIIHAGGVSGPMVLADHPGRIIAINVMGSLNLLQAALDEYVRTFVYCSSVSAVGDFYEEEPIGEDQPLRPASTYGCSKAAVDMVLRGLWRKVPLDLCSLRFTGVYGPGRQTQFVVDAIVAAAIAGVPAVVDPATDWPFVYGDDAADAAIAACFSDRRRQLTYFIAYPERVSLEDMAAATGAAGYPVQLQIDRSRPKSSRGPLDIGPAVRDFDFAPKIDHREGIRRMIEMRRNA